jgi:hypothetical protein
MDSLERRQASTVPARVLDTVLSTSATIAFFTRTDLLALIACRRGEQAYNS